MSRKIRDLSKESPFGRLKALCPTDQRTVGGSVVWKCLCDCGKVHYTSSNSLTNGLAQSCGCRRKELNESSGTPGADRIRALFRQGVSRMGIARRLGISKQRVYQVIPGRRPALEGQP